MDYKPTLNLPQTNFPMKANLAQREPERLNDWEAQHLYDVIRRRSKGRFRAARDCVKWGPVVHR